MQTFTRVYLLISRILNPPFDSGSVPGANQIVLRQWACHFACREKFHFLRTWTCSAVGIKSWKDQHCHSNPGRALLVAHVRLKLRESLSSSNGEALAIAVSSMPFGQRFLSSHHTWGELLAAPTTYWKETLSYFQRRPGLAFSSIFF